MSDIQGTHEGKEVCDVQERIKVVSKTLLECEGKLKNGVSGVEYAERAVRGMLVNKDSAFTQPVERSALLDALVDFLPKLQKANEEVKLARENFPWMDTSTPPAIVADNSKKRARAESELCESVVVPIPLRPGGGPTEFDALVEAQKLTYGQVKEADPCFVQDSETGAPYQPVSAHEGAGANVYTIPDDPAIIGAFRGAPPGLHIGTGNMMVNHGRSTLAGSGIFPGDPALMDPAILAVGARPSVEVDVYIPQAVASEYERAHRHHAHHELHGQPHYPYHHSGAGHHAAYIAPEPHYLDAQSEGKAGDGLLPDDVSKEQKGKKARSFGPSDGGRPGLN
ncbi:hypothetical protein FVE85_0506 [Porphyridium purpureum]|uniref:Uncharacterized protein n=1 Tax=Porphyridium purpureum TaxID=35688 RepID=A0A5J4Z293_PORPP|nr:hypothetical protein FVE85_0506 [Porphyridium purpureum]|eukprot:POR8096..scf208_2